MKLRVLEREGLIDGVLGRTRSGSCPEREALALARSRDGGVKECGFVDGMAGRRRCLHLRASVFSERLGGKSPAEIGLGV